MTPAARPPSRAWLPRAVVAALVLAAAAALLVPAPAGAPPSYALDSRLVWRLEIGAAVATALHAAIVAVYLASHGLTVTRVGMDGVDIPRVDCRGGAEGWRAADERAAGAEAVLVDEATGRQAQTGTLHQMTVQNLRNDDGDG